jgi:hypothetical protein
LQKKAPVQPALIGTKKKKTIKTQKGNNSMTTPEIKAHEEKISAQLQQTRAQLQELEARAKGKASQAVIDAIHRLRTQHDEIEKKRQELRTIGEARAGQIKAEIDAGIANLKTSLAELNAKISKAA